MTEPIDGANLPQEGWNPPTGEASFDDIFGDTSQQDVVAVEEPTSQVIEPQAQQAETEATPPASVKQTTLQTDPETGFILQTKTGTKYRTLEDAVRGTEEKDAQLEKLRNTVRMLTGEDPISKRPVTDSEVSYLADPNRYVQDKNRAAEVYAKTGDGRFYAQVEAKMMREQMQAVFGQYAPTVYELERSKAQKLASNSIPEFETFYGSSTYKDALEARPVLKDAIENAERSGVPATQLAELYKSAYDASNSLRLPQLLKQQQTPSAQNTPVRQPFGASKLTPNERDNNQNRTNPGLWEGKTTQERSAGRKALIEDFERKYGNANLDRLR